MTVQGLSSLSDCLEEIREQLDSQQDFIIVPITEYLSFRSDIEGLVQDTNKSLAETGVHYILLPKNERNFEFLIIAEKVTGVTVAKPAARKRLFRLEQVMLPARKYLNIQDCQVGISTQLTKGAEYIIVNHQDYGWWAKPLQEYLTLKSEEISQTYLPCAETFSLLGRDFVIIGKKPGSQGADSPSSVIEDILTAMSARQPIIYTESKYYSAYKKEIIDALFEHNLKSPTNRYGFIETESLMMGGRAYTRFAKLIKSSNDADNANTPKPITAPTSEPELPNPLHLLEEVNVDETALVKVYNSILKFSEENEPIMLWKTEWDLFPSEIIDYIEENCPGYRILETPASISVHGGSTLIVAEPPFPESSKVNINKPEPESEYEAAMSTLATHESPPEQTTALVKADTDLAITALRNAVLDLVISLIKDDSSKKLAIKELIWNLATTVNKTLLNFIQEASQEQLDFFVRSLDLTPAKKEANKEELCAAWLKVRSSLEALNPNANSEERETDSAQPDLYHCPVCGWLGLTGEPNYSFEVCDCCGVEIGQDNADGTPADNFLLRQEWLLRGAHWFKPAQKPNGWDTNSAENGVKQLQAAKLTVPGDSDPESRTRFCEAEITVYGLEGSESNGIELVLEEHWDIDAISVPWNSRKTEDIIVYVGQDFLRGGESEADLVDRLQIAIWSHLGRYTPITIETTLLEELSSNKFLAKPDLYKTYFAVKNEHCPVPRLTVPPLPSEETASSPEAKPENKNHFML